MAFTPPTRSQIRNRSVVRMLARDVPLTDLTQASALRIILEEMSIEEFMALWAGLSREQRQWFVQTATAENLERRLADFGLERQPARSATGFLTITNTSAAAITVPPGTLYRTAVDASGEVKRYQALTNPDDPSGNWTGVGSATVKVEAVITGAEGNVPAGAVVSLEGSDPAQEVITNAQPLVDGRGPESDEELRERFRNYFESLTRGTRGSIRFGLLNYVDAAGTRPVKSVAIVEWGGQQLLSGADGRPLALQIYIEDGTGTAAAGLVQEIQTLVDGDDTEDSGLRAAGAPTEVVAATPHPVEVAVKVIARGDVQQLVADAISTYIGRLPVAGSLITGELLGQVIYAQLFREVMDVDGVLEAEFISPTANRVIPVGRKAMPAAITVAVELAA